MSFVPRGRLGALSPSEWLFAVKFSSGIYLRSSKLWLKK
jgi:hypothetical protein